MTLCCLKKLVRDRIPEIHRKTVLPGDLAATFHQASCDEYNYFLRKKLQEEVDEFLENPCLEEMADIVEVLEAFCHEMGNSFEEMEAVRRSKAKDQGKFQQKWIIKKSFF